MKKASLGRGDRVACGAIALYLAVAAVFSSHMPVFMDESDIVRPALDLSLVDGSGGKTIKYPPLPFYLYAAFLGTTRHLASALGVPPRDFPMLAAARGFNLLVCGAALFLFFRVARSTFAGRVGPALLACFFLATTPAFFFATQMVKTESILVLLVVLSLLLSVRMMGREAPADWQWHFALGILAGLAIATKLNLAILVLYLPVAVRLGRGAPRSTVARGALAYVGGLVLALAPFLPQLVALHRQAGSTWLADEYLIPGPSYFRTASGSILLGRPLGLLWLWLPFSTGIAAYGLAVAGIVARGARPRYPLVWMAYPLGHLIVMMVYTPSTFAHLYTPIMPFLSVLAASASAPFLVRAPACWASLLAWASRSGPPGTARRQGGAATSWAWPTALALGSLVAVQAYEAPSYALCLRHYHENLTGFFRLDPGPQPGASFKGWNQVYLLSASSTRDLGAPAEIASFIAAGRARRVIVLDSYVHNLCARRGEGYDQPCRILRSALHGRSEYRIARRIETMYPMRELFRGLDPEFSFTFYLLVQPDDPLIGKAL